MLAEMGIQVVEVDDLAVPALYVDETAGTPAHPVRVRVLLIRRGASHEVQCRAADLILLGQVPQPRRSPSRG